MEKVKAILIDDEELSRSTLRSMLGKYCTQVQIIGEAENVGSGLELLSKEQPDVVFLDIQMPDGTGFDLLKLLNEIEFQVIFATAYDSYAIKAFEYSALDYLLKPVDPDKLISAVEKIVVNNKNDSQRQLETMLANLNGVKKIALPTSDGLRIIKVEEIVRCESESNYTNIYLKSGERILIPKTLKEYDNLLTPLGFYRVHHSHLINLSYIESYIRGEGGFAKLEDGREIEVSRRRKEGFLAALNHFLAG